jgi:hypothetical protein
MSLMVHVTVLTLANMVVHFVSRCLSVEYLRAYSDVL